MESLESGVWNPIRVYWHRQLMCKTQKTHKPKKPTNNNNPKRKDSYRYRLYSVSAPFCTHSTRATTRDMSSYIRSLSIAQHSKVGDDGFMSQTITMICMYVFYVVCLFVCTVVSFCFWLVAMHPFLHPQSSFCSSTFVSLSLSLSLCVLWVLFFCLAVSVRRWWSVVSVLHRRNRPKEKKRLLCRLGFSWVSNLVHKVHEACAFVVAKEASAAAVSILYCTKLRERVRENGMGWGLDISAFLCVLCTYKELTSFSAGCCGFTGLGARCMR